MSLLRHITSMVKSVHLVVLTVVLGASLAGASLAGAAVPGVAVVELFTSEGCSSCPPADRLLSKIGSEAEESGRLVFPLAYHVDYWDRLGWRDRLASPRWSDLQRHYASGLGESRIYTPQVIVNGRVSLVGSDASSLRAAITDAVGRPAAVALALELDVDRERRVVAANVKLSRPIPTAIVRVALVQNGLVTHVGGGENRGRDLQHDHVVRASATVEPTGSSAHADLEMPADMAAESATIVAYAQSTSSLEILGAIAAPLPAAHPSG